MDRWASTADKMSTLRPIGVTRDMGRSSLVLPVTGAAAQPRARLDAAARLEATLRPSAGSKVAAPTSGESQRVAWTADGALRYLGAPPGAAYPSPTPGSPETAALGFLRGERELLGVA